MNRHRLLLLPPMLFLLVLMLPFGCNETKKIPLFNPEARPINRIYSGKEIVTEMNKLAMQLVSDGLVTQEFVNKNVGPVLDKTAETLNTAELLYDAGNVTDANTKIETAKASLISIRETLTRIQRNRQ